MSDPAAELKGQIVRSIKASLRRGRTAEQIKRGDMFRSKMAELEAIEMTTPWELEIEAALKEKG